MLLTLKYVYNCYQNNINIWVFPDQHKVTTVMKKNALKRQLDIAEIKLHIHDGSKDMCYL